MTPTRSTSLEKLEPTGRLTDVPTVKLVAIHIHLELPISIARVRGVDGWLRFETEKSEQIRVGRVSMHRRPKIQLEESVEESSNLKLANKCASSASRDGPYHRKL